MAASEDLINFDIIENQKENIQSLPGGRSARELARIFSPRNAEDKLSSPSPNDTRTLNDAIRQEYEAELLTIGESDDPLDIYDRYVKWALNAYPTAQATPESGLLPLLERAVRAFLSSNHYKNDPRYLRLWLHYIRLFSDAPRETFAFLARHHIGEGLALFYEEFAAWLESAGRWTQADEVYRLGVDREARPVERLARKFSEFQQRYENRTQDSGPSSPALPAVRPALAAKVDPFASTSASTDPQAQQPTPVGGAPKSKSGKPKMAIFSDDGAANEPALGGQTKGWDSIGSLRDRKKENTMEAKPWAGETLKAGKKSGPTQKMAIFRDESNNSHVKEPMQSKHVPEHRVREAVNPRTGRRERVFVNLEAVYPDYTNPNHEISFEELRAISRGWMDRDWRSQKEPLKQISGNAPYPDPELPAETEELPGQMNQKLPIKDADSQQADQDAYEGKAGKARKLKLREIKGETQTIKMNFDSPTKNKIRRKSTNEPTMTIHTRAATDEIYDIFNQPLKAESGPNDSDFEDDDCTSVGDTTVGHISVASSDFGDDDTHSFRKSYDDGEGYDDTTQAASVAGSEWTEFTASRDIPDVSPAGPSTDLTSQDIDDGFSDGSSPMRPGRGRFVPEMPEDYVPPIGTYRDPEVMAQNRLPFMTPIVEQTEHSLASMTAARSNIYNAKTPSKPMLDTLQTPWGMPPIGDLLLSSPGSPDEKEDFTGLADEVALSPTAKKVFHNPRIGLPFSKQRHRRDPIIKDRQCNPTDAGIRRTIIESLDPPLASYSGYQVHDEESNYASEIQKFMKALNRRAKSGGETAFEIPVLEFPDAGRNYIIRRELGAGAYAPVYLSESVRNQDSNPSDSENDTGETGDSQNGNPLSRDRSPRDAFEAIKLEVGPPSAWEFYMIRIANERIAQNPELSRAAASIIRAHELHVFKTESFLIEDYRGQGTLLDLINIVRNESVATNPGGEGGLDEALAMFFTVELFRTVEALHASGILHGDIKADNFLIRFHDSPESPSLIDSSDDDGPSNTCEAYYSPRGSHGWASKGLSLIDFGRSIDMHAFHPSVQFTADWDPSTHECNEVRETRPWTHQIDLYGIAGTVHVMLFGKYLESTPDAKNPLGHAGTRAYRIRETLKRYWERDLWADVFDLLLNPGRDRWVDIERGAEEPCDENTVPGPVFPVLRSMRFLRERMEAWLVANAGRKGLAAQIRKLEVVFAEKRRKLERR